MRCMSRSLFAKKLRTVQVQTGGKNNFVLCFSTTTQFRVVILLHILRSPAPLHFSTNPCIHGTHHNRLQSFHFVSPLSGSPQKKERGGGFALASVRQSNEGKQRTSLPVICGKKERKN